MTLNILNTLNTSKGQVLQNMTCLNRAVILKKIKNEPRDLNMIEVAILSLSSSKLIFITLTQFLENGERGGVVKKNVPPFLQLWGHSMT